MNKENNFLIEITKLIKLKKNLILQCVPATGKIYKIAEITVNICM